MSGLRIVILGLSITSSWGNGHATNYRGLVRALSEHGHDVLFLERDVPWYAAARDVPDPPFGRTVLYRSVEELRQRFAGEMRRADAVVVGSYVPEGIAVGELVTSIAGGVTAFYDIDTPVTLATLAGETAGECAYLSAALIPRYDWYLSFTGGPTLDLLRERYGAPRPRAFYCMVDPHAYAPVEASLRYDLGYLGTYSADRQPALECLLLECARRRPDIRAVVAGAQYPADTVFPANVTYIPHVPPAEHPAFYCSQRLTLNITRADMVRAGWSPSVRLFEAGACAVPVVSDPWRGLDEIFRIGDEVLVARGPEDVLAALDRLDAPERGRIGGNARRRVLAEHTAEHRAVELEEMVRHTTRTGEAR